MNKILLYFYLITLPLSVFGQRVEVVESSRQYYDMDVFNSYQKREKKKFIKQQEAILSKQATRRALFKAFPSSLTAASVKFSENVKFDQFSAKTQSTYKRYMHEFANAQLVEVTDTDCRRFEENGEICIECTVSIIAAKIPESNIDIKVATYDGTDLELNAETDFNEGQNLFLSFLSPISGYISIYLDDFKETSRLLPYYYDSKNEACIKVEADVEYLLFSAKKENDKFNNVELVDELSLSTNSSYDLNRIYILYSKTPFDKPLLNVPNENRFANEQNDGYLIPKNTQSENFMNWLQKKRLREKNFQIEIIDISIKR
ncbi:MAG: hypothetical protein KAG37_03640 [Flavobacteriales bacterium]|nr:hypothetical protein [Flavobacteriales bacterium]